ncbi:phospholipase [Pseudomonas sp. A34-9]|uniref:phospholipase n=1 Tax=Pseudomonas sp. A34-9 TaxID=3034675 RepID=UPI00240DC2E9|nr:phospholipase [Pseudomonas sp. A34-9]
MPPRFLEKLVHHDWMTQTPEIDNLSLCELTLPGTHNAGCDNDAFDLPLPEPTGFLSLFEWRLPTHNWVVCQDVSFEMQLIRGARALDLRLLYDGEAKGFNRFRFQHGGYRSSRTLEDLVRDVKKFLSKYPDEFIVMDFHELQKGTSTFNHAEFKQLMLQHLGDRLIPAENLSLPLGQLKRTHPLQRILLAAPMPWGTEDSRISDPVIHKWIGQTFVDTSQLNRHIADVLSSPPDRRWLWSLSATCYTPLGGPQRIPAALDKWFDPARSDWAKKCNIINFDFIELHKIVSHCKTANLEKAIEKKEKAQTNLETSP